MVGHRHRAIYARQRPDCPFAPSPRYRRLVRRQGLGAAAAPARCARKLGERDASALLIAPTGAGKTLAGFLPTLDDLTAPSDARAFTPSISRRSRRWPSTSPATSTRPIAEMGLPIKVETRTGDTPALRRTRQRYDPAQHPDDHARAAGAAAEPRRSRPHVRHAAPHRARRTALRWSPTSAASCCRSASPGSRRWRRRCASPRSAPPSPGPTCCATGSPRRCPTQPPSC